MKQGMKRESCNRRTKVWRFVLAAAMVMFVTIRSSAATEYVSVTSTNPVPPYATPETAANNIQDAVNVATKNDTVMVEPGQYNLTSQVIISRGITLWGEGGAGQTFLKV